MAQPEGYISTSQPPKNLWLNLKDGFITVGMITNPNPNPNLKDGFITVGLINYGLDDDEGEEKEEQISLVKEHCLETGSWLTVKLDSLTANKATVFSFAPDEMRKVKKRTSSES